LPATWAHIGIGSLVLVVDGDPAEGYHCAVVQAVGDEANIADRQFATLVSRFPTTNGSLAG